MEVDSTGGMDLITDMSLMHFSTELGDGGRVMMRSRHSVCCRRSCQQCPPKVPAMMKLKICAGVLLPVVCDVTGAEASLITACTVTALTTLMSTA
jgi:hypothetical protein